MSATAGKYFEHRIGSYEERVRNRSTSRSRGVSAGPGGRTYSDTDTEGESEQLMTRPGVTAQEFASVPAVRGGDVIEGYYVANGPYQRVRYSAKQCGLVDLPEKYRRWYRPLAKDLIRPRPWHAQDDFARLGYEKDKIPEDNYDTGPKPPPTPEELLTKVKRWRGPTGD